MPALGQQADELNWPSLKTDYLAALERTPLADMARNTPWPRFHKGTAERLGLTKVTQLNFEEFLKRLLKTELGMKGPDGWMSPTSVVRSIVTPI